MDMRTQWGKGKCVSYSTTHFATPWTVAHQVPPPSVGFSRQAYWSGLPFPSPADLPDPGKELMSPALQVGSLPLGHQGRPTLKFGQHLILLYLISQFVYTWIKKLECHLLGSLRSLSSCRLVPKSCPTLLRPRGVWLARPLYPRDLPGKNSGRDAISFSTRPLRALSK